jgi:hypothetical protein
MKTPQFNLFEFTSRISNSKYRLGCVDCFSIILDYLSFRNIAIPDQFQGITRESYTILFLEDAIRAKELMVAFVDSLFRHRENVNLRMPGDILLTKLKTDSSSLSLAIESGNGMLICVSMELGVMIVSSQYYSILTCWIVE